MDGADCPQATRQHQLVAELCRVQELVRQLDLHLRSPSSSVDQCRLLAAEIVALTDRSIGIAAASTGTATPPLPLSSGAPSPLSDAGSDPFRGGNGSPKKRKATARWSSQVRVSAAAAGAGAEGGGGPADDGHSWRKYGQKDILGARHPRAYYRCTHRNSQGCPATKQVQRTDDDPALFDVVYHGDHTCSSKAGAGNRRHQPPQPQHNPHAETLLQSLGARLTVATAADGAAPPMTPESLPPARGASSSPWSLASPVGSDSNNNNNNNAYPLVAGYGEWPADGGDLQEAMSTFAEFMPPEYHLCFDDQSFHFGAADDAMPGLFSSNKEMRTEFRVLPAALSMSPWQEGRAEQSLFLNKNLCSSRNSSELLLIIRISEKSLFFHPLLFVLICSFPLHYSAC